MKRWKEKTRYQAISFFKEIIFFFISSFLSFPLHVKIIISCFFYLDDYKLTNAYSSLSKEYASYCIIDLDLISSSDFVGKNEVHISIPPAVEPYCKPVNIKVDLSPPQVITAPFCGQLTVIARFSSPHATCSKGLFHFPM
jgi:hypothetical protein